MHLGVSDRMANDGLLYDGWGKEGMANLNRTTELQRAAESVGVNRYEAVLIAARRAKDKAYQSAEDEVGYIGSSYGGPMGGISRRPPPATSQVLRAIEELCDEVEATGKLPALNREEEEEEEAAAAAGGGEAAADAAEADALAALEAADPESAAAAAAAAQRLGEVLGAEGAAEEALLLDDEFFDDALPLPEANGSSEPHKPQGGDDEVDDELLEFGGTDAGAADEERRPVDLRDADALEGLFKGAAQASKDEGAMETRIRGHIGDAG